jgi:hypothetical protein
MNLLLLIILLLLSAGLISAETTPSSARSSVELNDKMKASRMTEVLVSSAPGSWDYTIRNGEKPNSHRDITYIKMDIDGPVDGAEAPKGWKVEVTTAVQEVPIFGGRFHPEKAKTYPLNPLMIEWSVDEKQPPFQHAIAPGQNLGGFVIKSSSTISGRTSIQLSGGDSSKSFWSSDFKVFAPIREQN